jgi:hypothetical protein
MGGDAMTHDEARQIIKEHYNALAYTGDVDSLRQAVRYLGNMAAEHMAWDSAIDMAKWIKAQEGQP